MNPRIIFLLLFLNLHNVNAQFNLEWQKALGGSADELANATQQTSDGGFILAGFTISNNNGDVSGMMGGGDFWVVKLNSNGEVEWQKALGGEGIDQARSIIQTDDGGYAVTGISGSYNTGQVSGSQGFFDFWIVKLNLTGDIEWQKPIGGSSEDYGRAIVQTNDGGYVVGGFTSSDDGDVKNSDGTINYWVVKLAPDGKIQFQKTFGGSNVDSAYDLQNTTDGGYIIAGESMSNDGDVTGNHGKSDMWVVRIRGTNSSSQNPSSLPLNIFPNPATDQITLDIPEDELIHSVSFRDLLGREILQVEQHGTTINIGSMSKGVYLLQAVTESGEIYTGKLLKG